MSSRIDEKIIEFVASVCARLGRSIRRLDDMTHDEQFHFLGMIADRDRIRSMEAAEAAQRVGGSERAGTVVVDAAGRVVSGRLSAARRRKAEADAIDAMVDASPALRSVVLRLSERDLRLPDDAGLGWRYQALVTHFRALGEDGQYGIDALADALESDIAAEERRDAAVAALRRQRQATRRG